MDRRARRTPLRERGTQARAAKTTDDGATTTDTTDAGTSGTTSATGSGGSRAPKTGRSAASPEPRASAGAGYWPIVAIIAIIAATAGWTTVAVLALNRDDAGTAAVTTPSDQVDPSFDDTDLGASDAPVEALHEVPDLEAVLPTEAAGTPLAAQSWTGDTLLSDGGTWSEAITAWLTTVGKKPADLTAAQALDPNDTIDHSVGVFRVTDVPVTDLRDALVAAWKAEFPELVTSTITLDGIEVQKSDFGPDAINSYWYAHDGLLFDVETSDEAVATTLLPAIRDGETVPAMPAGSSAPAASEPATSPSAS